MTTRPLHPEFALEARELLAASRTLDAIGVCIGGIDAFPEYAGGYVMLAKAYAALGRADDAEALVNDISFRFPYVHIHLQAPDAEVLPAEEPADTQGSHVAVVEPPEESLDDVVEDDVVEDDVEIEDTAEEALTDQVGVSAAPAPTNVLRMIETAPVADDARIIRSGSVRLIPGLEFTTLRVEGLRSRGRRGIGSLPEPPAFRSFHAVRRPQRPAEPAVARRPVNLEELAARLIDAKMPRQSEMDASPPRSEPTPLQQPQPILVTDTIATIYMQQQSYDLAIEAFKTLMSRKPDSKERYEALIRECERKRGG
ncbi:MAG: hypothetical protein ACK475_04390 [Bacteroidota bacterium]|jgi:tetratricopeptide (TPR) repeat protein